MTIDRTSYGAKKMRCVNFTELGEIYFARLAVPREDTCALYDAYSAKSSSG